MQEQGFAVTPIEHWNHNRFSILDERNVCQNTGVEYRVYGVVVVRRLFTQLANLVLLYDFVFVG